MDNRCEITGNLCGTDTWAKDSPPDCRCGQIERLTAEAKNASLAAQMASLIPIGWIQEMHHGGFLFSAGDLNPKEVHDNGMPCHRVYKLPAKLPAEAEKLVRLITDVEELFINFSPEHIDKVSGTDIGTRIYRDLRGGKTRSQKLREAGFKPSSTPMRDGKGLPSDE